MAIIRGRNQREQVENMLGFAMPNFRSPNWGSGVRFAKYVAPRSRLVRMRGIRGLGDDYGAIANFGQDYQTGGEYPSDAYYQSVGSQTAAPTSVSPATGGSTVPWYQIGTGNSTATVPAQGGGTTSAPTSVLADITNLLRLGQQAVAQQRILDLNIERARNGLPMVDPRYFSPSAAVNFGLTPQMSQILLFGGIGIVAFMLLRRKK